MTETGTINEITMMTVGIGARKMKFGSSAMVSSLKVGDKVEFESNQKGWITQISKIAEDEGLVKKAEEKPAFVTADTLPPNPPKAEVKKEEPSKPPVVAAPVKEETPAPLVARECDKATTKEKPPVAVPTSPANVMPVNEDGTDNPAYKEKVFGDFSKEDLDNRQAFIDALKTKYPDMTSEEILQSTAVKFGPPPESRTTTNAPAGVPVKSSTVKEDPLLAGFDRCKYCNAPVMWVQEKVTVKRADGKTVRNVPYSIVIKDGIPVKDGVHDCRKKDGQGATGSGGISKEEAIMWESCFNCSQRIVDPLFQMGDDADSLDQNVRKKTAMVIIAATMLKEHMCKEMQVKGDA